MLAKQATLLCALAALAVSATAQEQSEKPKDKAENKPELAIGKPAPDFELKGSDGKTYKLSDYKDKTVVLEWWNQDCPVCKKYLPTMKELAKKYAEKDVAWLAIDSTHYQTAEKNKEFAEKHSIEYPILMDSDGKIGRYYEARTTPHMFVVHKGTLVYDGAIDDQGERNYIAEALDAVLADKPVPLAKTKPFGCSVKYAK